MIVKKNGPSHQWSELLAGSLLIFALAGCGGGGSSGSGGSAAAPGPASGSTITSAALAASTALTMNITGASINSPPVVDFLVTNQDGVGMAGLIEADLRFNIAKLAPGSNGEPSAWQNYINRTNGGAVQGSQERSAPGYAFGTLVNRGNGTYTYTFATDIKDSAANPCPTPCTDAAGKALDISFQPNLTHRVTIEQSNSAYPKATGVFDFVPSGGTGAAREIVLTSTCNQCHEQLSAHGTRVDTKLCVTCHNPGTWVAGSPNQTVDFKVMIHKIHNASDLPSVTSVAPLTDYVIGGTNFSNIGPRSGSVRGPVFPQDVRNCSKCHDGALSAQGDNWKNRPNMDACGSCHDNVNFAASSNPAKPIPHPGGVMTDSSTCALCHAAGRFTDNKDIVVVHSFPARLKAASAKFKYNIIAVTPTPAAALSTPTITFSVTDPTNGDKPYDIKTDPHFTAGANSTLNIKLGWASTANPAGVTPRLDYGNEKSGQNYGQPISINLLGNAAVVAGSSAGTYTVTSTVAIPAGQTGTLRVAMDGHPAGDVTIPGTFTDRLQVKSVFKDFAITGTASARRLVVDIGKCNVCHDVLSLHGSNRTDEPGVCAICHNPDATDAAQRPKSTAGVLTGGADGKLEESIDFKTMIHAIHAGQSSKGGFRTTGITIYGFGGSVNDFSNVIFPGKLSNCAACHAGTAYQLTGTWASPTANGILGTTTSTGALAADPSDNLRTSPIAAVCSSCHDNAVAKSHMQSPGMGGSFSATQSTLDGAIESCNFCHGSGRFLDVKTVHSVQ